MFYAASYNLPFFNLVTNNFLIFIKNCFGLFLKLINFSKLINTLQRTYKQ